MKSVAHWLYGNLLWDTGGVVPSGTFSILWATRKLLMVMVVTILLTWREWIEHHPPEIALIFFLHFIFVFAIAALLTYALQQIKRMVRG
jgi:hypothetical protein